MKTLQIKVIGKVQGVGFRYYTEKRAKQFEIKGFVQNKTDGSVIIEAEGKDSDVRALADWCEKGPSWSRVREVKISELPFVGYDSFEVK